MNLNYFQTANLEKNLSNQIIEPPIPPPLLKSISSLLLDFMLFKGSSLSQLQIAKGMWFANYSPERMNCAMMNCASLRKIHK